MKINIKFFKSILSVLILAIMLLSFVSCDAISNAIDDLGGDDETNTGAGTNTDTDYVEPDYEIPEGTIEYHFIDIGQGDAELILVNGKAVLIDTGLSKAREQLTAYLQKYNVTELEYFIATHPDADHIGSADYVVENYKIKNVIMSPKTHTTKTYERFIAALEAREEINVINAQDMLGESIFIDDFEMKILGPIGEFNKSDNNNPSVVIMARWGKTKVLLTGDAETEAEERIIERFGAELDCDVLKVGHHGSHSSTWESGLLNYAKPEVAIISCGEGNDYGHPHTETMEALNNKGITIYRTDLEGSIVLVSDGQEITKK